MFSYSFPFSIDLNNITGFLYQTPVPVFMVYVVQMYWSRIAKLIFLNIGFEPSDKFNDSYYYTDSAHLNTIRIFETCIFPYGKNLLVQPQKYKKINFLRLILCYLQIYIAGKTYL